MKTDLQHAFISRGRRHLKRTFWVFGCLNLKVAIVYWNIYHKVMIFWKLNNIYYCIYINTYIRVSVYTCTCILFIYMNFIYLLTRRLEFCEVKFMFSSLWINQVNLRCFVQGAFPNAFFCCCCLTNFQTVLFAAVPQNLSQECKPCGEQCELAPEPLKWSQSL